MLSNYILPKSLEVNNKEYGIRSDFRAILDIIYALNDPNLSDKEKATILIMILYVDYKDIDNYQEAVEKGLWFISGGEDYKSNNGMVLMDWEQDFKLIVGPVNRVLGYECRSKEYLHWWTFISAYYEIGRCTFSNVVNIRYKKKKNKRMEKWEKEFYRDNIGTIELKRRVSEEERELIEEALK